MKKQSSLLTFLFILIFFLTACSLGSGALPTKESPTSLPNPADPQAPTQASPSITSRGPGDFDLVLTGVGLDSLHSYHQSLQTIFEGTINGESQQSQTTLTREILDEPPAQLTWIETGGQPVQFFGRVGGVNYRQPSPDITCSAAPVSAVDSQPAPGDFPLAALPPISGAEFSDEGEVNGVPAKHYTFDERAIGYAGQAAAQGEVWVASSGGQVLRYALRLEAPDGLLGPGVSGVQSWFYELSEVDTGKNSLPENCQQLQENTSIPMLDGASVILQQPGILVYQVTSSVDAATAFYQQQAETLGWTAGAPFFFGNVTRVTMRPADGGLVQLTFETNGDQLTVTVQTLAPMAEE